MSVKLNGNSAASKNADTKNVKAVTSNVIVKKESELKKFKKQVFTEDGKTVKSMVVTNVIIPGVQRLLRDIISNAADWFIYGARGGGGSNHSGSGIGGVKYNNYFTNSKTAIASPQGSVPRTTVYSVNDVIFRELVDAEESLMQMREIVERYGSATVNDFYDMTSQKSQYTDQKYGWRDLSTAEVVRNRDGYHIRFPKVVVVAE